MGSQSKAFADRFVQAAQAIEQSSPKALNEASFKAKKVIEAERNKAVGSDGRMSGVGKNGAKLGVKYNIEQAGSSFTSFVKATGPWQFIENDTRSAGVVRAKRYRRAVQGPDLREVGKKRQRKRGRNRFAGSGARAVTVASGVYRASFRDGPTTGKKPFSKGMKKAQPVVAKALRAPITKSVRDAF